MVRPLVACAVALLAGCRVADTFPLEPAPGGAADAGPRDGGPRDAGVIPDGGCATPSVTHELRGRVLRITDDANRLADVVPIGAPIVGRYTYDPTLPDGDPRPTHGDYPHAGSCYEIVLSVGGLEFGTELTASDLRVQIVDDAPGDRFDVLSRSNRRSRLPNGDVVRPTYVGWTIEDPGGRALSSDALTLEPPPFAAFSQAIGLVVEIDSGPNEVIIRGRVDTIF